MFGQNPPAPISMQLNFWRICVRRHKIINLYLRSKQVHLGLVQTCLIQFRENKNFWKNGVQTFLSLEISLFLIGFCHVFPIFQFYFFVLQICEQNILTCSSMNWVQKYSRGIFRTQPNIYDGDFSMKVVDSF